MLSPLDAEARKTVLGIKALLSEPLSGSHWRNAAGQAELRIDGALLERWAAKTFLNSILADVALSPEKTPYFAVSSGQLVETVFRSKPFPANQGLWLLRPDCNYLQNTDFGLSWIRVATVTSEVNWWRQEQPGWTGPWRVPVMFYFAIHRFEFALLANLTSLGNEEWSTMMAVQRKALDDIGARLRPSGMTLSIPKSQNSSTEAIETRTIAFY